MFETWDRRSLATNHSMSRFDVWDIRSFFFPPYTRARLFLAHRVPPLCPFLGFLFLSVARILGAMCSCDFFRFRFWYFGGRVFVLYARRRLTTAGRKVRRLYLRMFEKNGNESFFYWFWIYSKFICDSGVGNNNLEKKLIYLIRNKLKFWNIYHFNELKAVKV